MYVVEQYKPPDKILSYTQRCCAWVVDLRFYSLDAKSP